MSFAANNVHMRYCYTILLVVLALAAQAVHEIEVEDNEFDPPSLTIKAGDIVNIVWDEAAVMDHNIIEVDASTWIANGTTPLAGGYQFGDGTSTPGHQHTITPTQNVWYVCGFHASMGMKGTITVIGSVDVIEEATVQEQFRFAPNPAAYRASFVQPQDRTVGVDVADGVGRTCLGASITGAATLELTSLPVGAYIVVVRDMEGTLLSNQRQVVAGPSALWSRR